MMSFQAVGLIRFGDSWSKEEQIGVSRRRPGGGRVAGPKRRGETRAGGALGGAHAAVRALRCPSSGGQESRGSDCTSPEPKLGRGGCWGDGSGLEGSRRCSRMAWEVAERRTTATTRRVPPQRRQSEDVAAERAFQSLGPGDGAPGLARADGLRCHRARGCLGQRRRGPQARARRRGAPGHWGRRRGRESASTSDCSAGFAASAPRRLRRGGGRTPARAVSHPRRRAPHRPRQELVEGPEELLRALEVGERPGLHGARTTSPADRRPWAPPGNPRSHPGPRGPSTPEA